MRRRLTMRGFTLVEALVALAIIAAGATVLISTFANGARESARQAQSNEIFITAQSRLELLMLEVSAGAGTFDRRGGNTMMEWRESAAAISESPVGGRTLFKVSVTVSARNADRPRRITLVNYTPGPSRRQ